MFCRRALAGQHNSRGTIIDAAGIACGDTAVFLERRAQSSQNVATCCPWVFIGVEMPGRFSAPYINTDNLVDKAPLGDGVRGAVLTCLLNAS